MNVINDNLFKYNISAKNIDKEIIDNIIFNEKKHIVSIFKEYLILDESCDFISKYYSLFESLTLLFTISNNSNNNFIPTLSDIEKEMIILKGMKRKIEKINFIKKKTHKKLNKEFPLENNISMLSIDSQKTIELSEQDKIIIGCKDFGDVNDYSLLFQLISNKKKKKTITHYKNEDKKKVNNNLMKKFNYVKQNKITLYNKSPNKINRNNILNQKINLNNKKKTTNEKFYTIELNNNIINDKKNSTKTSRNKLIKKKDLKIIKTCNTDENQKFKKKFNFIESYNSMKKNLSYKPIKTTKSITKSSNSKNSHLSETIFPEKINIKKSVINLRNNKNINSRNKDNKILNSKSINSVNNLFIANRKNSFNNNRISKTPLNSKPTSLIKSKPNNQIKNKNNNKLKSNVLLKKDKELYSLKNNNLFPKNKESIKKKILNKLKLD